MPRHPKRQWVDLVMSKSTDALIGLDEFSKHLSQSTTGQIALRQVGRDRFVINLNPSFNGMRFVLADPADLSSPLRFESLEACARYAMRTFEIRVYTLDFWEPSGG